MTQEAALHRQVYFLRARLALAKVNAAGNYMLAATVGTGFSACLWAVLGSVLEDGPDNGVHWLGAIPVVVAAICAWTASNHHRAEHQNLAKAVEDARAEGYSVSVLRSGIHFALKPEH
jgi:hypothetical protein